MKFELKTSMDMAALAKQAENFPKAGTSALNRIAKECKSNLACEVAQKYNIRSLKYQAHSRSCRQHRTTYGCASRPGHACCQRYASFSV